VDRAATIVRQAMEWAEYGGGGKPTLNEYVGHNFVAQDFGLWGEWSLDDFRSYEDRVQAALKIMDGALETFGVEGFSGRSVYGHDGLSYLNTGDTYTPTVIYDYKSGTWKITSWGDMVEAYPSRFPY
jgi:hypothetical protein